jgi:hypothetical protein
MAAVDGETRARMMPSPSMATLFGMVFALGGLRSGLSRLSDNSFFWHLRTGRWMLSHGIPRHDLYSFSAPHTAWIAQSWLAELVYGAVDRAVGPFGVRLLGALTGAAVATAAYTLALRLARNRVTAALVALASVGASFTLWSERPLFLGILAFVGLVWIVEVPDVWLARRAVWTVPVVMWLWANVHGTFSLGFLYLALHVGGRWLDGAPPWEGRERTLVLATAIAFALCFANPYGPALVFFPIHLLQRGDILKTVIEWRSPDFRSAQGLAFAGWLGVTIGCLALGQHRPTRRDVVVLIPFVALALWAMRNIAVAPLVGLPVLARAVAGERLPDDRRPLHIGVAALLAVLAWFWVIDAATGPNFDTREYPVAAMRAVARDGRLGQRLLTDDAWAGYVILKFWPAQRVFVDDRFDMYPRPVLRDFLALSNGTARWRSILDRNRIDVVVWDRGAPLATYLAGEPAWRRLHRDRRAVVYVRV